MTVPPYTQEGTCARTQTGPFHCSSICNLRTNLGATDGEGGCKGRGILQGLDTKSIHSFGMFL